LFVGPPGAGLLFAQKFTPENVEFQAKILARSGLGEETNLPPGLITVPPSISMADARLEFQQV
jgi:3-ketoacyl-CoA synthase